MYQANDMTSLTNILDQDPTLLAADKALEAKEFSQPARASRLGMGAIGESCSRKIWYRFRLALRERFDAKSLKNFADGHHSEQVQAERLRLVPGITLETIDPATGIQFEYTDCNGHFVGKLDGKITGLLQAPSKLHIWEHKSTSEKKFNDLKKIKAEVGEKNALRKWNPIYYAQGQLYMFYEGTDRHYMTVSSAGVRDAIGLRTEANPAFAMQLKAKAQRIITSDEPPEKVSNTASWFECKFCPFKGICHEQEMPDRSCRTCLHSTPIEDGKWHCERLGKILTSEEQSDGCVLHKYLPKLVPGEIAKATEKGITYKLHGGGMWYDGE